MSWTRFFRRRYWDEERARELEAYLEAETDENIARGMSPEEARYAAHRKLGNTTLIREEIYHMNSLGWLETLWQDLRLRSAHAGEESRLHGGGGADARARHRRECGRIQPARHGLVAPASLLTPRPAVHVLSR